MRLIFDAHLDLAWNALSFNRDLTLSVEEIRERERHMRDKPCRGKGTVSLAALRQARVAVCVATLLARGGPRQKPQSSYSRTDLDYPNQAIAHAAAQGQLAYYRQLERQGRISLIRTAEQLETHWRGWAEGHGPQRLGIILSMEGSDPIVTPSQAGLWWADGLRAAGLAHYGESHYAFGTGVDGPLSDAGLQLLKEFQRLGIALDVTHLCDRSLEQALDVFEGPVLASHHNCRALAPHERQLSDQQIKRLIERGAVIGAALDNWMLVAGWEKGSSLAAAVRMSDVAEHIDRVCQIAGNALHSAIGSDLDGGFGKEQTPGDLDTVADLQLLAPALEDKGFREDDVNAVFHGNWLRFFKNSLP